MTEATAAAATQPSLAELHAESLTALRQSLGEGQFVVSEFRDNLRVAVESGQLIRTITTLRDQAGYAVLAELGAADYLNYPGRAPDRARFEVHYILLNPDRNRRIVVKVGVPLSEPTLPSLTGLWGGANWMEREIFDMFGISFDGHPDLRRLLMPEEFAAHPLRKDYPLRGRGERHNFPRLSRSDT